MSVASIPEVGQRPARVEARLAPKGGRLAQSRCRPRRGTPSRHPGRVGRGASRDKATGRLRGRVLRSRSHRSLTVAEFRPWGKAREAATGGSDRVGCQCQISRAAAGPCSVVWCRAGCRRSMTMLRFLDRLRGGRHPPEPGWIEPGELHRRLDAGDPLRVVDVRGLDDPTACSGTSPGRSQPAAWRTAGAAGGIDGRSPIACLRLPDRQKIGASGRMLQAAGYGDVVVLRGGGAALARGGLWRRGLMLARRPCPSGKKPKRRLWTPASPKTERKRPARGAPAIARRRAVSHMG